MCTDHETKKYKNAFVFTVVFSAKTHITKMYVMI